jgi:hypothetical protein
VESLIHLLMLMELGVPVLGCVFLEITPPAIALSIAAYVVHQGTALWDLEFTSPKREISPVEQQVHSFLETLPLLAITLLATLHWPEFRALLPSGDGRTEDFSLRLRRKPPPARYVAGLLGAITLLNGLPYLEELWRCLREPSAKGNHGIQKVIS